MSTHCWLRHLHEGHLHTTAGILSKSRVCQNPQSVLTHLTLRRNTCYSSSSGKTAPSHYSHLF